MPIGSAPVVPFEPVAQPNVWTGAELARSQSWMRRLDQAKVEELETALDGIRKRGLDLVDLKRSDFPLPTLGPLLKEVREDVIHGRGFAVIRGLPVRRYSFEEIATIYLGMGTYLGDRISQNGRGHLLGHVTNLGESAKDPGRRLYRTGLPIAFHTDSCDMALLLCYTKAAGKGGKSKIASSAMIHNEMLRQRPDLVRVLTQTFYTDRRGETPAGYKPYYALPVFNYYAGYLSVAYGNGDIVTAQRFAEVPRLSPVQREAMALFETLADQFCLETGLDEGDIQLLHNHAVCHARTAYQDPAQGQTKRHLLRLWLSYSSGRPLPPCYEDRYGAIVPGHPRGGIVVPGMRLNVPLQPE